MPTLEMAEGKCDPTMYNTSSWEEERCPDRMSAMYQRKRPASREEDAFSSENLPSVATEGGGDELLAAKTLAAVPIEVLDTVFEFLDGNGLLSCERVSYRWRLATDRTHLWKRACLAAFPHLGDYYFDSAYLCCSAYEGNWRETFLDGNRENRSAVLDWNIEAVADAAGDPEESERRYSPPFSLCGNSFSLLADPGGNPRAIIQEQAAGTPRVEKGLSVYLKVTFNEELPDAPPWGGLGVGFQPPYRPPSLSLGSCHPWGASEEELGGINCHGNKGCGVVAEVPRDPHGLRRRRRRFRRREGRVKGVSHAGDPEAIARECCAAFSLAAVNKAGRKDIMWMSSMEGDRFYPDRNSWGVHCLLPTSVIQDPEEGFLQDGSLTVRLRVRLLFLIAHVYTTADLASHRGFGVVPVRGKEQSFHYTGDAREAKAANRGGNPPPPGPLSCLTFEVLRCTTLADMEHLVAQALNLASTQDLRLWVISQPLTDGPLAPRQLLSGEDAPSNLLDGGQESPSLFRLLPVDTLDETCRVRLWAEQRSDAGFWEAEMSHPRWQMPVDYADGTRRTVPRPASREVFAGVRLACSSDTPPWLMHSPLAWGSAGYPRDWLSAVMAEASGSDPGQAHEASSEENGSGTAVGSLDAEDSTDNHPPREKRILVFLKTLGLREGGRNGGDGDKPAYLTHVVLRRRSSLRSLFELVVDLLRDGTAPEELGAYIEDLPCAWQGRTTGGMSVRSERNRSTSGSDSRDSPSCVSGAGRRKAPQTPPSKRFFACPAMDPSQHPFVPWTTEFIMKSNKEFNARGKDGCMSAHSPSADALARTNCVKFGRDQTLTLEGAGVTSGASLCFFRSGGEGGRQRKGEMMVRSVYTAIASKLVEDMRKLLRGEGPLGRVHLIKLHEVVEMCESLGYQGFRARITHDQQRHVNARETLEYVARGRHLAFICDSCGTQDFTGARYHCLQCPDYDLCRNCYVKGDPVPPHRYIFIGGHWKREGGFHEHDDLHDLEEIWSMPTNGCHWRRRKC